MEARSIYHAKEMVRLHVLADSDRARAQRLKARVVRAVRKTAARICAGAENADTAFARLQICEAQLLKPARRAARLRGFFGCVRVETGRFMFPGRIYGQKYAPAGEYRAVRVLLGRGEGRNWWCVLYPELCVLDALGAAALAKGAPVEFYSSVLRVVQRLFGWGAGM